MSKKHFLLSTVLYVVLFFGLTGEVLGDASEQFEQAGTHEKNKEYDQAEEIYQQILASSPDPNDALKAQTRLTRLYIAADRQPEADAALQKLLADFSWHPDIAQAVREIADHYRGLEKYAKAKQLYQHVLDNWPQHEQAMWAQAGLAILNISLGNDSAAEAAVDKLLSDFSGYKNIVAGIRQTAHYYGVIGKYENAIEIHQYVLDNWPKTKQAIQSQKQLVLLSLQLEDEAGANSATEKLLTEFSADNRIPRIVADIANKYQILQRHEQAGQLYQYIVDNWPESDTAVRAQAEVAISNIGLGNDPAAETAFNELISDFSDDPRLPEAIWRMADFCRGKLQKYEQAREFYQYVLDNWPDSEKAIDAQVGLAISYIGLGNDPNAQADSDKLIADYNDVPTLPQALFQIAEQYFYRDDYQQAIELWEFILTEYPGSSSESEIPYLLATCYERMKDYPTAVQYYTEVVERYPDSHYGWRGPYRLGVLYKRLGDYEQAVYWFGQQRKLYSNESTSEHALFWQGNIYLFNIKDYLKAVEKFEEYIELYPKSGEAPEVWFDLAMAYEKMGDKTQAIALLQEALSLYPNTIFTKHITDKLVELQEEK